jgi:hypothetical protein
VLALTVDTARLKVLAEPVGVAVRTPVLPREVFSGAVAAPNRPITGLRVVAEALAPIAMGFRRKGSIVRAFEPYARYIQTFAEEMALSFFCSDCENHCRGGFPS